MNKEKIAKYIKNHKMILTIAGLLIIAPLSFVLVMSKPKLELKIFDGTLIWDYNKKIGDNKYVLYRNGEKILSSNQIKFRDNESGDKSEPDDVSNIDVKYKEDNIIVSWNKPKDNGNTNNYYVALEDNTGNIILKSNEVSMESTSGISGYKIEFNNEEKNLSTNEYVIDSKNIKEGIYDFNVTAIDGAGNESKSFSKIIEIFRPYIKNNEIHINNKKKYVYKAYVNGDQITVDENKIKVDELKDINAPEQIKKISVWNRGTSASILWSAVKDTGSTYDVEIKGTTVDGDKVAGTGEINCEASGVKGYYYAIKDTMDYKLSYSDKFTSKTLILNAELPYETNYLHVAAVDNEGNIGQSYVKVLEGNIDESEVIDKVGDQITIE